MKRHLWTYSAAAVLMGALQPHALGVVLFEENFDGLLPTLGGSVNERVGTALVTRVASDPDSTPLSGVWSASAAGWTVDNGLNEYDGVPTLTPGVAGLGVDDYGVDEWQGWSFPRKDFWVAAAGDQRRSEFGALSGASGTIAVVDPDEYYDLGDPDNAVNGGYYSSALRSSTFPVVAGGFYGLGFDSSWRDEAFDDATPTLTDQNNQAVEVIASFDVGGSVQVVKWNSDSTAGNPFFKDDAPDEPFLSDGSNYFFEAPAGASSASLSFRIANAGNDWWWAVDNIQVDDLSGGAGTVFAEDFESSVTLGDSVNERLGAGAKVTSAPGSVSTVLGVDYPTSSRPESFTHTPPAQWNVDNAGTPGVGDDNLGALEWEQWSFVTPEFFQFAGGSGREEFAKGTGVFAVADGDNWDDLASPGQNGDLLTLLKTPLISLAGLADGELVKVAFDSSWRPEDDQVAVLTALLDGAAVELLRWESGSASPFFHARNTNESVAIFFDPAGASELQLTFDYAGNNDWWWAIDNVSVTSSATVPEPSTAMLFGAVIAAGGLLRRKRK
ncbi:hypothetical protein Pla175_29190 [Pirellulimonas nuda]|uniref:Ice-binding protein C-terminal domain-containing protein n=1 Tax=Pirellulimonas nuda TaxID=2528009 RepID=A0A518DDH9_9BACT|nr:PEP-CTERM sorting domain-containing protein [Pirellulimonas nuda]QDU89527.1 hypothetical protein Pla175_29190 [Pirellulimonas nuda]